MTSVQSPSLTEASSVIRVAIVCEPETTVLADSLEALLQDARGFTFSRFEYRAESDLKPKPVGVANPDVVVATLDSFQAIKVQPLLAPLQRAFPNRPLLVTTMHPDAFDVFPLLEAGAADFLLPPLRASDVLPRLKRQARVSPGTTALVERLKQDIGLKQIIGESPQFLEKTVRTAICAMRRHCADLRRVWHWQGAFCARYPLPQFACRPSVRSRQLRRASGEPGGKRDLRS